MKPIECTKVIGRRFRIANNLTAEVYNSGMIILVQGKDFEFYDKDGQLNSTTNQHISLRAQLWAPGNIRQTIERHGQPYGMIWGYPL
jgi:hypothetical protein